MKKVSSIIFILILILTSLNVCAAAYFGAEFTFTNSTSARESSNNRMYVRMEESAKAQLALRNEFAKNCLRNETCYILPLKNQYGHYDFRVIFPERNNFWVQISTDPAVVEIQTRPSTIAEYEKNKDILDRLFTSAKKVGITPSADGIGGGHIHMDYASSFKDDPRLFRNFIVDYFNHSELAGEGVLSKYAQNSPALHELDPKSHQNLINIIEEFDQGKIKTAKELAMRINNEVYFSTPFKVNPPAKYQALNLMRMLEEDGISTLEFRNFYPQQSPDEFIKELTMLEARVNFLKKQDGFVKLLEIKPQTPEQMASSFKSYIQESGLNWDQYKYITKNHDRYVHKKVTAVSRLELVKPQSPAGEATPTTNTISAQCSNYYNRLLTVFRTPIN